VRGAGAAGAAGAASTAAGAAAAVLQAGDVGLSPLKSAALPLLLRFLLGPFQPRPRGCRGPPGRCAGDARPSRNIPACPSCSSFPGAAMESIPSYFLCPFFLLYFFGRAFAIGRAKHFAAQKRIWCLPGPCPHSHQGRGRPHTQQLPSCRCRRQSRPSRHHQGRSGRQSRSSSGS
jgi:hypothetical protein